MLKVNIYEKIEIFFNIFYIIISFDKNSNITCFQNCKNKNISK